MGVWRHAQMARPSAIVFLVPSAVTCDDGRKSGLLRKREPRPEDQKKREGMLRITSSSRRVAAGAHRL